MSKPKARGLEALDREYGAVDGCECVGPCCCAPTPVPDVPGPEDGGARFYGNTLPLDAPAELRVVQEPAAQAAEDESWLERMIREHQDDVDFHSGSGDPMLEVVAWHIARLRGAGKTEVPSPSEDPST